MGDKENTSWMGRYLAQKALRHQVRQDNSLSSNVASVPAVAIMTAGGPVMVPYAYVGNELMNNMAVQGSKISEARKKLNASEKSTKSRSWKDQTMEGLKKSPLWALGGAIGGGLGGYAMTGNPTTALYSSLGMGAAGAATPIIASLLSKLIIDSSSKETLRRAKKVNAESPVTSSFPFGDMVLASGADRNPLDRVAVN